MSDPLKIVIFGAGYVGKRIAKKWHSDGHFVCTTTRKKNRVNDLKEISDHVIILNEPLDLKQKIPKKTDVIVFSVAADDKSTYKSAYLDNAKLLSDLANSLPNLKHLIYTGSTSVYGDHQGRVVDEKSLLKANHKTAKILIEAENVLLTSFTNCTVFRLGEIIGPSRSILEKLKLRHGQVFPGTGENITNIVHIDDILAAIDLVLTRKLFGVYNLSSDMHVTRKTLYDTLCKRHHLQPIIWDEKIENIHGGNKVVSSDKIKGCGFQFTHDTLNS